MTGLVINIDSDDETMSSGNCGYNDVESDDKVDNASIRRLLADHADIQCLYHE